MQVEFGILGPLLLTENGRELTLPGARERSVLTYLLLHAGEVVSVDRLVDELWGEAPPKTARKSLRVRVTGIRHVVGDGVLLTQASGYVVRLGRDQLDLHRFEQLVADADTAEPATASDILRRALSLWRGPPLGEFSYEPFAQRAIARLEEMHVTALERRIEADLALGRHAALVAELEALVAEHPLREHLRGQLILALYRSGRQTEALAAYAAARRTLVEEIGIDPSPALQALERAILRQDPGLLAEPLATPRRSILVALLDGRGDETLLRLAESLARQPPKELIVTRLVGSTDALGKAAASVEQRRRSLTAGGVTARASAFVSASPASDVVRVAAVHDVDVALVRGTHELLHDEVLRGVLTKAPCDVAVVVGGPVREGGVLVPFVGADHDWAAVEVGAWLAGALGVDLVIAGPLDRPGRRDASRLLSDASLAIQHALGVAARPLLVEPGPASLLAAADGMGLVVVGLTDRWRTDGLGPVREALAREARLPVVLVRGGLRPGGLAPRAGLTRFTWSIGG